MDPQALLERLLDLDIDLATEAADGGELSEVDSASEALADWMRKDGFRPDASEAQLERLKELCRMLLTHPRSRLGSDSELGTNADLAGRLLKLEHWLTAE